MLKQIDHFYKYIMITLLVVYLINYVYFGKATITFIIVALAIVLELIRQRHHIKQLTYAQLSIIGVVLLAGIAGIIYLFVLFRIFIVPLSLPTAVEDILLIVFALICLYVLGFFLKKLYVHAIEKH
ncbi:hypothetical protein WAX74_20640 [Psychrobacillus sp. FJAT-51614]|uniref:Uncharacterized protein n=1 Tax=Psychrobacillus mangrovi TaxID=3117745 RepID=A0ABU8FAH1_9BACI